LKSEVLPEQQQVFRVKVVTAFHFCCHPPEQAWDLIEEGAYQLTDLRHMSDLVPFVLKQEQQQLHAEISVSSCLPFLMVQPALGLFCGSLVKIGPLNND